MNQLLEKINHGYDGLIKEIRIFNDNKDAEVIISVMDFSRNQEWINVVFTIREIKEFKIHQKLNFSNVVLSGGIKFKVIENISYIDYSPYSDEIDTLEDFRFSDMYFASNTIEWKIIPYE